MLLLHGIEIEDLIPIRVPLFYFLLDGQFTCLVSVPVLWIAGVDQA